MSFIAAYAITATVFAIILLAGLLNNQPGDHSAFVRGLSATLGALVIVGACALGAVGLQTVIGVLQ
jgi:hypothetical protein